MFYELVRSAALIFLAELGDKTQILAMTFALQFSVGQVLAGVALGSFLNHGLAVIVGAYLAHLIPLSAIRLGSAVLFLGFGLWTLKSSEDEDDDIRKGISSPVLMVALAFFLGELGDKTQLTAIALASDCRFPAAVLAGTVTGMVLTSFAAIIIGSKVGEKIPKLALKLVSSAVFIVFGLLHLSRSVPLEYLTLGNMVIFLVALGGVILYLSLPLFKQKAAGESQLGSFQVAAGSLYALDRALSELCLKDKVCREDRCPVGYCKRLLREELAAQKSARGQKPLGFRLRKPYVKKDQIFNTNRLEKVLRILEDANLDPLVYQELKQNLEKLRH